MRAKVLVVPLALVAGCSRDDESRRGTPASSKAAASFPASSTRTGMASDPELEQVRALLDEWRVAQETLDFQRYSRLYAAAFRGVKRVGERRFRFDRRSFLADRQPMFKPRLSVKVSGVELVRVERSIAAFFT